MKVMVVGGTGHIGGFMVPQLVHSGHDVSVIGSGKTPVPDESIWQKVNYIKCDISEQDQLNQLAETAPDVLIAVTGDYKKLYEFFKKSIKHYIACGSLWMFGNPTVVPTPEIIQGPCAFPGYTDRLNVFHDLLKQCPQDGINFSALMPPNICGPGKVPLECLGGRSVDVHRKHMAGKEVVLPDGPEVLIGPCDAEDIARCFVLAVNNPDKAAYQIFNVGSSYALIASRFVSLYSTIYGKDIPVKKINWQDYKENISPDIGHWWHFWAHMCPDISKARRLLGYEPQYTPEQTIERAVEWMLRTKKSVVI